MSDPYGRTWWGRKWWRALETIGLNYPDQRIVRGRALAGHGSVTGLAIEPGLVSGRVADANGAFDAQIAIPVYNASAWAAGMTALSLSPSCVAGLLAGRLPKRIDDVLAETGMRLLPKKFVTEDHNRITTSCGCADAREVCAHIMALALVSAARMDDDPWLVLLLRGGPTRDLAGRLRAARLASMEAAQPVA
ncbi:hypothetical protein GCM10009853_079190 [Glycomyces scopariae]|uniref:SWIM-type domain-containing protein n=1 Tax=Glycomyces sambucus TaxID=380244 RepID=A0A1G9EWN2_9ACTN|nr:hypothetical protein [Glycomyces sambucus]SDK80582.1 hypothetical protein SAMN05216298_1442 [Glycomyces sambucus]